MPFRRDIGRRTEAWRQLDGISVESGDTGLHNCRPLARSTFDGLRAEAAASTDCTERVAAVLQKLGYGFATIPHGKSAPQSN